MKGLVLFALFDVVCISGCGSTQMQSVAPAPSTAPAPRTAPASPSPPVTTTVSGHFMAVLEA